MLLDTGAYNVRVFGSAARGEPDPDSDVDFLANLEEGRGLLDLVALSMDLWNLLDREIDIVMEPGLHWYIRDEVIEEVRPLRRTRCST